MFEQIQQNALSFNKQFAQSLVLSNQILVDSFEKLVDVQLKHVDAYMGNLTSFSTDLMQATDAEGLRAMLPKTVELTKQSGELAQTAAKDLIAIVSNTTESLSHVAKGSLESVAAEASVKAKAKRAA